MRVDCMGFGKVFLDHNIPTIAATPELHHIPWSIGNASLPLCASATLASGGSALPSSSNTTLVPVGLCTLIFNFFFFEIRVVGLQRKKQTKSLHKINANHVKDNELKRNFNS